MRISDWSSDVCSSDLMDDAYAIQDTWVAAKMRSGDRVMGWKIGLTSQAMQSALSIDTPDSGVLFDSMAFDNGAVIPADRFIQQRIEAELAFVLKRPLEGRKHGRASSRGRVCQQVEISVSRVSIKKKNNKRTWNRDKQ